MFRKIFAARVTSPGSLGLVVTRGHTGRSSPVGSDYRLAEAWAKCSDRDQLLRHEAADLFRRALKSCQVHHVYSLVVYRGRSDDTVSSWKEMGPPRSAISGGRYNSVGWVVLYLCDSVAGVRREVTRNAGTRLCVQRYEIPAKALKLLDGSGQVSELVGGAFDMAESARVDGRVGPSDFQFGQVVAQLVREAGFGGMLIPGVRGDAELKYRNVIVFEPGDRWIEWSQKDEGFSVIDGAS